ncbi:putative protein of unknown function (DUF3752) [Lyophyllum shimeji]|uniref:DUF3752 domain-containing protein n=1 Tax=Lyophyllum shimeji TaxID=47721 RepID=A0A9P3UKM0_LYOSH|nr:putative protein of unknown function (DUF3752) [Lyophyllum shimeji]
MPAIGPELPPHLQRPSEEEEKTETVVVGPQIPPDLLNNQVKDEDDEDDYVPELPPDLAAAHSAAGPSTVEMSASSSSAARRVVGPSLPSYPPTYDPKLHAAYEEEDDDDVGPKPLPAGVKYAEKDAVQEFMEREERRRKEAEEAAKPKALKRDEWMLVPPSSSDLLAKLDPTKLKGGRQFSRSSAPAAGKTDSSLWTETPAERQQRLADEVSGKKRRAVDTATDEDAVAERKRSKVEEERIRRGVEEYTQTLRGPSLINQYQASGKADASKDKDAAIWDHDRDINSFARRGGWAIASVRGRAEVFYDYGGRTLRTTP